ncbi:LysE family translocator [Ferrimonas balearica]|uniref:LysE family translocator n=1 Tax=Ferrimonas balearica TaxID=44012 RepID=UPI001C56DE45|nr:LysE family translocator [Ferrimonas balearica]MBY6018077.1 LysE family translocator [Halomonas denitrificans]MBW3137975.1 LysE family translocator [Ferrimonas balearica]MBW3164459.1 LysE family translocator [Ferrimonas balearica]MBY6094416.1 LysE family translocator [Ferrimonas balearica]MBY6105052.1 LysE family translocator [Ferrimonas balearica]
MSTELYLVYLATVVVLLAAPGPMTLMTLSTSVRFGHGRALFTVLGSNVAGLILMVLSATGIGALITAQPMLYDLLRYGGAAYLIWLGINAWRARKATPAAEGYQHQCRSRRALFRETLMVGLANPKGLLFFAALFPQFIQSGENLTEQFMILSLTFTAVDFVILNLVALGGCALANHLANPGAQKGFNRCCGLVFMSLGGMMLLY